MHIAHDKSCHNWRQETTHQVEGKPGETPFFISYEVFQLFPDIGVEVGVDPPFYLVPSYINNGTGHIHIERVEFNDNPVFDRNYSDH